MNASVSFLLNPPPPDPLVPLVTPSMIFSCRTLVYFGSRYYHARQNNYSQNFFFRELIYRLQIQMTGLMELFLSYRYRLQIFHRCGSENGNFLSRSFRKLDFSVEVVPKMVIFRQGGSENGNFPSRWFRK